MSLDLPLSKQEQRDRFMQTLSEDNEFLLGMVQSSRTEVSGFRCMENKSEANLLVEVAAASTISLKSTVATQVSGSDLDSKVQADSTSNEQLGVECCAYYLGNRAAAVIS